MMSPIPKMPGVSGVIMGTVVLGLPWALAEALSLQLAFTMLGAALIAEGLGRIRDEARRGLARRPAATITLAQELTTAAHSLGSLQAVHRTDQWRLNSLVVLLVALACAGGEVYLLEWLREEMHIKLIAAAAALPLMAGYLLYRAARILFERADVLVFERGIACIRGGDIQVFPWEKIEAVRHEHIGDAIDEHAVVIRPKYGQSPWRFTCCHFHNLEQLRARLQHAFESHLDAVQEGTPTG